MPRNVSPTSAPAAPPSDSVSATISRLLTFGSRCQKMMRARRGAGRPRRDDVLRLAQREHLRADDARDPHPAEDRERAEDQEVAGRAGADDPVEAGEVFQVFRRGLDAVEQRRGDDE